MVLCNTVPKYCGWLSTRKNMKLSEIKAVRETILDELPVNNLTVMMGNKKKYCHLYYNGESSDDEQPNKAFAIPADFDFCKFRINITE